MNKMTSNHRTVYTLAVLAAVLLTISGVSIFLLGGPGVGVELLLRRGDSVSAGQPWVAIRWSEGASDLPAARALLRQTIVIGDTVSPPPPPLVIERLGRTP